MLRSTTNTLANQIQATLFLSVGFPTNYIEKKPQLVLHFNMQKSTNWDLNISRKQKTFILLHHSDLESIFQSTSSSSLSSLSMYQVAGF